VLRYGLSIPIFKGSVWHWPTWSAEFRLLRASRGFGDSWRAVGSHAFSRRRLGGVGQCGERGRSGEMRQKQIGCRSSIKGQVRNGEKRNIFCR
jgi:hypothetical protein